MYMYNNNNFWTSFCSNTSESKLFKSKTAKTARRKRFAKGFLLTEENKV